MQLATESLAPAAAARYAKCVEVSKRIRWDIDRDVIRGRRFDFAQKFLPDAFALTDRLPFLTEPERRLLSQVQGRTYARMFALVERFIGAKMLELSAHHWLGDQAALEALVRLTDEELKHQELFRRIEALVAEGMPEGYAFLPQPNDVATFVLGKSTWAVLALTCHIELFSQTHYRQSIEPDAHLSGLFKDVFFFHWKEESQHAIIDELEWRREHAALDEAGRDRGVDDLIALVAGVDGLLQMQAPADAAYFMACAGRAFSAEEARSINDTVLRAYRWQYIVSGVENERFAAMLADLTTPPQLERITAALQPILS
jgi:hypothetical protein